MSREYLAHLDCIRPEDAVYEAEWETYVAWLGYVPSDQELAGLDEKEEED